MSSKGNKYIQRGELKLLTGNSNIKLAESVAKNLEFDLREDPWL